MKRKTYLTRRATMKGIGAAAALSLAGTKNAYSNEKSFFHSGFSSNIRKKLFQKISRTPFIDTHEHLIEEKGRFTGTSHPRIKSDYWTMVLSHYLNSDMLTSGMPQETFDRFFSPDVDPVDKWDLLEPWWPYVKNTGYGQAVSIALKELYDVDKLSAKTVRKIQSGYEKVRRPGFYRHILCDLSNIESCQVNSLEGVPFMESDMPELLMQDISIVGMFAGPGFKQFGEPTGININSLSDWYKVIDWWFTKYGKYAVAVKSQNAYSRDIDYRKVPAEKVEA
ncbi:MAG: hypothetical protein HOC71_08920, partial [Candidatus Latescibacteria bacterium]|nr:hypothetical protein [Candidatus Latescibacterota bacterium]